MQLLKNTTYTLAILLATIGGSLVFIGNPPLSLSPAIAAASAGQIYTKITSQQLLKIMQSEGYSVSVDEDNDLLWKINGYKTFIFISDSKGSIQFFGSFKNSEATLEKVNAWNRDKRFSTSYIQENGSVALKLDLDFEGGITKDRIISFVKTCLASYTNWMDDVV